jgi:[acyl-carrier-protein] S-malonyltransferase
MAKQKALVICPGRGTYNKDDLGYFARQHADRAELMAAFDVKRLALGQETLSDLDGAARYSLARHTRGDNASALIYACAYADFQAINRDAFDIVAVTGNSMGWYIALATAGVLDAGGGFDLVNTMGTLMHDSLIGGQILYPFVDADWVEIPGRRQELLSLVDNIDGLFVSIHLGGMMVFAGDEAALSAAEQRLEPVQGRFPMRLKNHAGFHSPLQAPVLVKGQAALPPSLFGVPDLPLIDGRGHIWQVRATHSTALRAYTLGAQVVECYDFNAALRSALHEFCPDKIIIPGPGTTLGGAIGQCLIANSWLGLRNKADFIKMQAENPFVLAMGQQDQRRLVVGRGSAERSATVADVATTGASGGSI